MTIAELLIMSLLIALPVTSSQGQRKTDREHDLLKGPVQNVQVSFAKLLNKSGKPEEGNREFLRSFKYDAKGMLVEKTFIEDRMKIRHLYSYDSKGNRIGSAIGSNGGKLLSWLFKYDSAGNRIEESVVDDGSVISTTVYKYDANSNKIEETIKRRNFKVMKRIYIYDDKGNIQGVAEYMESILVRKESYTYEFDSFGNWVKRVASISVNKGGQTQSEPANVMHRTISYYP